MSVGLAIEILRLRDRGTSVSGMALLVSQRARLSYVEISNFLRSSRAAPLHVGGRKPRNFIQPKYVDLKKRSIHQARYLRSEQEARGLVPEMFEKYMDSCMSLISNILSKARMERKQFSLF